MGRKNWQTVSARDCNQMQMKLVGHSAGAVQMQHISGVGILFIFFTKYYWDCLDGKGDNFSKAHPGLFGKAEVNSCSFRYSLMHGT